MIRRCPGWMEGAHPTFNHPQLPESMRGQPIPRYLGQIHTEDPDYKKHKHEETTGLCPDCLKALRESQPGIVRDRRVETVDA